MISSPLLRSGVISAFLLSCLSLSPVIQAQVTTQKKLHTRADSLRGSIGPERAWWDADWYGIDIEPDYSEKFLRGEVSMGFKTLAEGRRMQLDLQAPMEIRKILWQNRELPFTRDGNAWFVDFGESLPAGTYQQVRVYFEGKPTVAVRPPWDGGWIFSRDKQGRPWMSVACQGLGASVWFPCKDHQGDEPDSARLRIVVADSLVAVSNGQLRQVEKLEGGKSAWTWAVRNPINTYNIIPYIGKYTHWEETYAGEKGNLACSYWVLDYEVEKAKAQFAQVSPMLRCFEDWFGPYPFYEDGYKLVQSPHLGMEHQSAVAYGNQFKNGYLGRDLSQTGWGLKWDFIIIHESGHEWFGNNVSAKDLADMWIHESFTNYSETIYTQCQSGKEAGDTYVRGTRALIQNDAPIVGPYGVNEEGSGDMYYKGGNMIHYIRQLIDNDSIFRACLRGMNQAFYHQTVTYQDILSYWNRTSGKDFTMLFAQYLKDTRIPVLQWQFRAGGIRYRWTQCIDGYNVPVRVRSQDGQSYRWLKPTTRWQSLKWQGPVDKLDIDPNFYAGIEAYRGK